MKRCIGEMQDMLMHTVTPIAEIADMLGFSSICHFNAMFKKYTGLDRICHSIRELMYYPKNITKRLVVVHAKRLAGQQLFLPERFCIYDLML